MLTSFIEARIREVCGRYIKDFRSESLTLTVGGLLTLLDIEINVEELDRLPILYKPTFAYLGRVEAQIPLVIGGKIEARISDVIVMVSKGDEEAAAPSEVHRALQTWISMMYMYCFNTEGASQSNIPSSKVKDLQVWLDVLSVSISNVHVRVEDSCRTHIPCNAEKDSMCTGLLLSRLEILSPSAAECSDDPFYSQLASSGKSMHSTITIQKAVKISGLKIYCYREFPLGSFITSVERRCLLEITRQQFLMKRNGILLHPLDIVVKTSISYQKAAQVFGPVFVDVFFKDIELKVNDEQLVYILCTARRLETHISRLQVRSRSALSLQRPGNSSFSSSQRALMRWAMLREMVRKDWWRYTKKLEEGSNRWRSWFNMWRAAGKYIALRELLVPHVGYESFSDGDNSSVRHVFYESLLVDHKDSGVGNSSSKYTTPRYEGRGLLPHNVMQAAESLLADKLKGDCSVNPLSLSPTVIRALYAIQMELDTLLPVHVSAMCRIWTEERIKLRTDDTDVPSMNLSTAGGARECDEGSKTMCIAILDATNLRSSLGFTSITSFCTMRLVNWKCGKPVVFTETVTSEIARGTGTALASWGEMYSFPVNESTSSESVPGITIECSDKGLLNISYGRASITQSDLIGRSSLSVGNSSGEDNIGQILIHNCDLGDSSSSNCVTVRLLSCLVQGDVFSPGYQNALARIRSRVADAVKEKKQLVERQQQIAEREKDKSGFQDDDESGFVLDPSQLTVQDLKVKVIIPSITIFVEAMYSIPNTSEEKKSTVKSLTVLKVILKEFQFSGTAKNNPWDAQVSASVESLKILDMIAVRAENQQSTDISPLVFAKTQSSPLVCLPGARADFSITQVSSIGRNVDGNLNLSCFEWSGVLSFLSFKFIVSPRSFKSLTSQGLLSLWRTNYILEHLWVPIFPFGLGAAVMSLGSASRSASNSFETSSRYGGIYEEFPLHANYCNEIWAGVRHSTGGLEGSIVQESVYAFLTEKRACDVELSLRLDESALDGTAGVDDEDDLGDEFEDIDDDKGINELTVGSASISSNAFLDFFTFGALKTNSESSVPTSVLDVTKSVAVVSGEPKLLRAKSVDSAVVGSTDFRSLSRGNPNSLWELERTAMQKRILELELKTRELETKLLEQQQHLLASAERPSSGKSTPVNLGL